MFFQLRYLLDVQLSPPRLISLLPPHPFFCRSSVDFAVQRLPVAPSLVKYTMTPFFSPNIQWISAPPFSVPEFSLSGSKRPGDMCFPPHSGQVRFSSCFFRRFDSSSGSFPTFLLLLSLQPSHIVDTPPPPPLLLGRSLIDEEPRPTSVFRQAYSLPGGLVSSCKRGNVKNSPPLSPSCL